MLRESIKSLNSNEEEALYYFWGFEPLLFG